MTEREREPETHGWRGRNYTFTSVDGGQTGRLVFWTDFPNGPTPRVGDFVILRSGERGSRYRVDEVSRASGEGDVCGGKVTFVPRVHEATHE